MACAYDDTRSCPPSVCYNTPVFSKTEFRRAKTIIREYNVKYRATDIKYNKYQRCKSEGCQYKKKCYTMDQFPRLQYHHKQVYCLVERTKQFFSTKANFPPMNNASIHLYVAGDITRRTERLIASSTDEDYKYKPTGKKRWPISALIYFQSEDEPLDRIEKLIESFYPVSWTQIFIVTKKYIRSFKTFGTSNYCLLDRKKESVREAITSFLEIPLRECIQMLLENLEHENMYKVMKEEELSNLRKDCRALSLLLSPKKASTCEIKTPDSIKEFLFRRPGIHGFGLWMASEFRVFVNYDTDTELLKSELCKLSPDFFYKISLSVVNSDMKVKMYTKQGDKLFLNAEKDDSYATTGALLKNDIDPDDIYGLTCHHALPREEQQVFAKFSGTSHPLKIGECVYSNNEPNHDFAVYRVDDDKRRMCDTTFLNAMSNPCNVNIQEGHIPPDALVHKKGASTEWTTGRIESSEFYARLFGEESKMFLVSSAEMSGRSFSAEGDSGSVVFLHDSSPSQKSVFALGLVTGKIDGVRVEGLSEAVNSTVCLRLNTALSCLSERKQLDLKFESSIRESSSSDEAD